jgi:uncharacterized membrane protein required for colicin V production
VTIDVAVLAVLFLAGGLGLISGAIRQLAHLGGLVAGWFTARPLAGLVGPLAAKQLGYPLLPTTVACSFACFFVGYIVAVFALRFVRGIGPARRRARMLTRMGGFLLGAAKAAILVFVALSLLAFARSASSSSARLQEGGRALAGDEAGAATRPVRLAAGRERPGRILNAEPATRSRPPGSPWTRSSRRSRATAREGHGGRSGHPPRAAGGGTSPRCSPACASWTRLSDPKADGEADALRRGGGPVTGQAAEGRREARRGSRPRSRRGPRPLRSKGPGSEPRPGGELPAGSRG